MSSLTETKTSPSPSNISTTPSNPTFYRASFTRPPSISVDLFRSSSTAMKEGITRNPYAHHDSSNPDPKPNCKCEYSKKFDFSICIDCKQKSILQPQIAKEEKLKQQILEEDASHQDQHMTMLHACGVTIEWLLAFTFDHNCWHHPTWWVNRHIIKEATRHNRRRYMDLDEMKQHKRPATVFMSHCWGAVWGDMVLAACHGARFGRVVWIDLFAVRQWPGNVADLNFREVISYCDAFVFSTSPVDALNVYMGSYASPGTVMQLNEKRNTFLATDKGKAAKKSLPFFRLWCIVELTAAIILNKPIVVKGGSVKNSIDGRYEYDTKCIGYLMDNLRLMIDVDASECSVQADYDREMAVIRNLEGGSKGVNALVVGVVNGAKESIDNNILEIDAYVCNEPESLRALNIPLGCEGEERKLADRVLAAACAGGRESIVKELLLKWSVKKDDDQNKEGETKRNDSMKKEKEKERKWLIQLIDDSRVLWYASRGGNIRVVERILEVVGINVNGFGYDDATPLYKASANGNVAIVKVLLAAKDINVNQARQWMGDTPLDIATESNHTETIQLLKDAGAKIKVKKNTPTSSEAPWTEDERLSNRRIFR